MNVFPTKPSPTKKNSTHMICIDVIWRKESNTMRCTMLPASANNLLPFRSAILGAHKHPNTMPMNTKAPKSPIDLWLVHSKESLAYILFNEVGFEKSILYSISSEPQNVSGLHSYQSTSWKPLHKYSGCSS